MTFSIIQKSQLEQIQRQLIISLKPALNFQKQLNKNLKPILEFQQNYYNQFKCLADSVLKTLSFIKEYEKVKKSEKDAFLNNGWWLSPSMMGAPAIWISQAANNYKNGNKTAIFSLFRKVYQTKKCKNLKIIIEEWNKNSFFKSSMSIIDEALDAHKNKQYRLSVPALLLTAEGIATDYCKKKKLSFQNIKSKGGQKIKLALKDQQLYNASIWFTELDCLENAINERIFNNTDNLKRQKLLSKNILSRHAIMHGLKRNYGTMKNSLQCFMLLDCLSILK